MLRSSVLLIGRMSSLPLPPYHPLRLFSTGLKMSYIPQKVKEEMAGLYSEDAARWNATTLAVRFGAPRENVEMWLRLCKLRGIVSKKAKRTAEEEKAVEGMREKAATAWKALPEVTERRRWVTAPSTIEASENGGGTEVSMKVEGGETEATEVAGEKDATVEEETEEKIVQKSRTAEWVETFCENAPRDVSRRTTFAFIEVSRKKGEELERAVWIREGVSGCLRVARKEEREVLLSKVRSQDASVWKMGS